MFLFSSELHNLQLGLDFTCVKNGDTLCSILFQSVHFISSMTRWSWMLMWVGGLYMLLNSLVLNVTWIALH